MSKIALAGAVSGTATFTIESPATSTNRTLTLPDNTGTIITQNSTPAFASTIGVGGATPSTSGAGITFPATQSASSNANTLDDYEEGTWTPAAPVGLTVSTATYQKIGNTVLINAFISVNSNADGANFIITGLPYALSTGSSSVGCFNSNANDLYAYLDTNGVNIRNSSNVTRTCANLSGNFVAFQLSYIT